VFWITLLLLYPVFFLLLQRESWFPAAFRLKRRWSQAFQWLLFCPVRIEMRGSLPKPPFIIVSNHSSYLDTVFMYSVMPEYFLFIGKGELLKWPLFGLFFKKMDIPVHRENHRHAHLALQKAYQALEKGHCVALYPEGTIPRDAPRMKAFKNGAFRMSVDKQVPIVAITWTNVWQVMCDPERLFSPSLPRRVVAVVHAPLYPQGKDDQDLIALRSRVFSTINEALPEPYRKKT
jgi:1-acyl-sn-glycerol-3-phosphate acyltransferase